GSYRVAQACSLAQHAARCVPRDHALVHLHHRVDGQHRATARSRHRRRQRAACTRQSHGGAVAARDHAKAAANLAAIGAPVSGCVP
ncbi:MAG: hypothetical protein QGF33_08945, partial [Alphaproteobacteria bacterium]|nr:hypothetical protein [Alphaproteobacteria bacterium]